LSPEDAFRVLVRLSQNQNVKAHAVAQRLVSTGEYPGLSRPR
jgi:hypothetical protein